MSRNDDMGSDRELFTSALSFMDKQKERLKVWIDAVSKVDEEEKDYDEETVDEEEKDDDEDSVDHRKLSDRK